MLKRYTFLFLGLLTPLLIASAAPVFAVDVIGPGVCDRYNATKKEDRPAVCQDNDIKDSSGKQQNPIFGKDGILSKAISILSIVVSIVAIISIILAGLKFISSGNNPQEVNKAREIIIYACIALGVAALAQAVVQFVIGRVF